MPAAPDAGSPARATLPRKASLKSRRLIRTLFDRRRTDVYTTAVGCVRLLARSVDLAEAALPTPVQVAFSPGRNARRAVDRNRIKRLLRAVYRERQHALRACFEARDDQLTVMVLFRGRPAEASAHIPRDLPVALHRLAAQYCPAPPEAPSAARG